MCMYLITDINYFNIFVFLSGHDNSKIPASLGESRGLSSY